MLSSTSSYFSSLCLLLLTNGICVMSNSADGFLRHYSAGFDPVAAERVVVVFGL